MITKKAKKIFFGNYKGGVGKTTSTYNIAVELAKEKFNKGVLVIDLDPQSSLSGICMTAYGKEFGVKFDLASLSKNETLNYIYTTYMQATKIGNINFSYSTNQEMAYKVVKRLESKKIHFIPNNLFSEFGGLDRISINIKENVSDLLILRNFIEDSGINNTFDFIFFDCPPSNNIITQSAFLYSDYYIIPTIMDSLSINGVSHYVSVIKNIYENHCVNGEAANVLALLFGNEPKLIGTFETMRKGNLDTSTHRNSLIKKGYYVFENRIHHRKDVADKISEGHEAGNDEYPLLTEEFVWRIEQMENR